MKMTCKKLKKLEDPESVLCKAVLINNTLKYLQQNSANANRNQQPPQLVADTDSELDLDILNREIQFPSPPLNDQNISSENDFFHISCRSFNTDDVLSEESQELCRDIENRNTHTIASQDSMTELSSYQDEGSKLYDISSSSCTSSICSNTQSILNLPLHRIVQCKV